MAGLIDEDAEHSRKSCEEERSNASAARTRRLCRQGPTAVIDKETAQQEEVRRGH